MDLRRVALAVVGVALALAAVPGEGVATVGAPGTSTRYPRPHPSRPQVDSLRCPLLFLENRGQVDPRVAYYAPGKGLSVYFTPEGLTWALTDGNRRWAVKQDFVGARKDARPVARDRKETVFSWFKGPKEKWVTGVPSFGTLEYTDLWPGIDMVCAAGADRMKTLFVVRPGADPGRIRFAWRGATTVAVTGTGSLRVETPAGRFEDEAPVAWQEVEGGRAEVQSAFVQGAGAVGEAARGWGFRVGAYDRARSLLVDPVVVIHAGYLGGSGDDYANGIAVDASGNAYVAGYSGSSEASFPVAAGPDLTWNGGNDAFVAKVQADGTGLTWCGYIGGAGDDFAKAIAVDGSGNAYVAGHSFSSEASFPVVAGPDLTFDLFIDAFVAKVQADGTGLIYCGYIGGAGVDFAKAIAVDGSGNAYVAGDTFSSEASFPVAAGPDLTYNGDQDAFVAKVRADGTGLTYCGYIGGAANVDILGSGHDIATCIAVDGSGNAYVAGQSTSPDASFPVAAGPDVTWNGATDAFVAKVRADGTGLTYCGYIGGFDEDRAYGIAVDGSGNAYVAGYSESPPPSFPVVAGPDLTGGGEDAFVAKVRSDGTGLTYCGYIGGAFEDRANGIAVDGSGNAYVAGYSKSSEASFPVAAGPDLTHNGGISDAFVAKVRADGTGLTYCGYIGGAGEDLAYGIAVDGSGNAYVAGYSGSSEASFPVAAGPDLTWNGGSDAFVAKISPFSPAIPAVPSALAAAAITASRIDLSWVDNSDEEAALEVERGSGGGAFTPLATLALDAVSYSDTSCVPLRDYSYRVRATNEAGASGYSTEATATTPGSLDLVVVKGTLLDRAEAAGDSFEARGTLTFSSFAPDAAYDPAADGLEVSFGEPGTPYGIVHLAGAVVWKSKRGKFTWKSARGETPKAKLTLDLGKGKFAVSARSFDFPAAPTGPVEIFLRTGNDAGAREDTWTPVPERTGLLKKR